MRPTRAIPTIALVAATSLAGLAACGGASRPDTTIAASSAAPEPGRPVTLGAPRVADPSPLAPRAPADGRDAPDPFILRDGNRWVLYSTQVGLLNVPVATADDLATWSPPIDALPVLPGWAEWGRTWAPGGLERPGGFVLYFSALSRATGRQCIGAATAADATGPFVPASAEPLVCQAELGGSIDPHPFVDGDGTPYLLWKADGNAVGRASVLYAQRLRPDGLGLDGEPAQLLRVDTGWEDPLIENPALVHVAGRYLLLYSGGWWESDDYATGYATCDSPLGPCAKVTNEAPLHATGGDVAGPGGASVIVGPAGDMWLVHHGWAPGAVGYRAGGARSVRFASLTWDGAKLSVSSPPARGLAGEPVSTARPPSVVARS
jgi:beta-xylosidase